MPNGEFQKLPYMHVTDKLENDDLRCFSIKYNEDIWKYYETHCWTKQWVGKTFIHLLYDLSVTCAYSINSKRTTGQN